MNSNMICKQCAGTGSRDSKGNKCYNCYGVGLLSEHLGNANEILVFVERMNKELKKHQDEKSGQRRWNFESVMLNNIPEIKLRIDKINNINVEIKNDIFNDRIMKNKKEMLKQFTHIANYCLLSFTMIQRDLENEL